MEDIALVENRNHSFLVVNTAVPCQQAQKWNAFFPTVKPLINYSSTSQPELLDALKNAGCYFYYEEFDFFSAVKDSINRENLFVADFSENGFSGYIDVLRGEDIHMVSVNSLEKIQAYQQQQYHLNYILRISVTDDVFDVGCTLKEASSILSEVNKLGIPIFALLVSCRDTKDISPVVTAIKSLLDQASTLHMSISNVLIVGEGVQKLIIEEKQEEKKEIEELASRVTLYVDGSRFFTESAYTIYNRIIAMKAKDDGKIKHNLYYTDNGVYCSFYNRHIHNEPLDPKPISLHGPFGETLIQSTIFGPTCDSIDTLGTEFMLPVMKLGDWFKFENCGYLCSNFSSRFNGFRDPDVIVMCVCLFQNTHIFEVMD